MWSRWYPVILFAALLSEKLADSSPQLWNFGNNRGSVRFEDITSSSDRAHRPNDAPIRDAAFITRSGHTYRDMLTIKASRAVAKFAEAYQLRENNQIRRNRHLNRITGNDVSQNPRFSSSTFNRFITAGGLEVEDSGNGTRRNTISEINFKDSRKIRTPSDHKREQRIAMREEKNILIQRAIEDNLLSGAVSDVDVRGHDKMRIPQNDNKDSVTFPTILAKSLPERPRTLFPASDTTYTTTINFGVPSQLYESKEPSTLRFVREHMDDGYGPADNQDYLLVPQFDQLPSRLHHQPSYLLDIDHPTQTSHSSRTGEGFAYQFSVLH